jgi:hypothetical protein
MSSSYSDVSSDTSITIARVIAVLLIVASLLLNGSALGWLIAGDKVFSSAELLLAIRIAQGLLALAGIVILMMPAFLANRPLLKKLAVVFVGIALVAGLIGNLGLRNAPIIDYRVSTYPLFECAAADAFCNTAPAAGLTDEIRYGKGTAFADIDGDGWVDLFAADAEPRDNEDWGVSDFYLNNGDGTFRNADIGVSDDDLLSSWTGSFADIDNDGDQDLILVGGGYAGSGRIALYENRMQEEGKFISITDAAGFKELHDELYRWWGVSWADFNKDGYLDLAVSRVYGDALLFKNNGNNTFTDVTEKMGIKTPMARERDGKNIVWFDYDLDGDADLYYAGIFGHMFFENLEGKFFLDVTDKVFAGLLPQNWLWPEGIPVVFSAAAVDINQDGADDLYLGRQAEQDLVLFNDGTGRFQAKGQEIGIDANLTAKNNEIDSFENTMGLGVGDLFDDGWPDIIIGSGDPVRADEDIIYCNRQGTFERCTEVLRDNADGPFRTRTHGVVFADINHDGALDVFQNLGGHAPWDLKSGIDSRERSALFVANAANGNNTATVLLEGGSSNRDAIGARIKAVAQETHYYWVRSTQAFQSQNERSIIISMGQADAAELEIVWPDGETSKASISVGSRVLLKQGSEPADL